MDFSDIFRDKLYSDMNSVYGIQSIEVISDNPSFILCIEHKEHVIVDELLRSVLSNYVRLENLSEDNSLVLYTVQQDKTTLEAYVSTTSVPLEEN